MKRTRYIPNNATAVEHAFGIVYTYNEHGRCFAIAYSGKRSKPDWHIVFRNETQRTERIERYFGSLNAHAEQIAALRQQRTEPHTLKVGDIVYNS